jgi:hypothetical protein
MLDKCIAVVDNHILGQSVPGPFPICIYRLIYLEQDVQYGYQYYKGENIHPLGKEIQQYRPYQILAVRPQVSPHYI